MVTWRCVSYSVVVGMLVSVTTTIIKGVRGFVFEQDTEPVSSVYVWIGVGFRVLQCYMHREGILFKRL